MKFQYNNFGEYTLQSDLFKDFWFLKCQLVKGFQNENQEFTLKEEHLNMLPDIHKNTLAPIGHYGKVDFASNEPDYNTLKIIVYYDYVDGISFVTEFKINMSTGVVTLKISVNIYKPEYKTPPEFPEATVEWLEKNIDMYESVWDGHLSDNISLLEPAKQEFIDKVILKRYSTNFENWLNYLSKLRRVPDEKIPPCSVACPHKHKLIISGVEYCKDKLYKLL